MRVFANLEELAAVPPGEHLGVSPWLRIEQDRVDAFAAATDDHQWIHVDVERATDGPYGGTIAHGYLLLALLPHLLRATLRVEEVAIGINYGLDRVRFPAPVRVGAEVRLSLGLLGPVWAGDALRVRSSATFELAEGERPACIAESISHYVRATAR